MLKRLLKKATSSAFLLGPSGTGKSTWILHSTYGIVCDGILTLDKKFAKKIAVAINALGLKTEIDTDANKLLQRIAVK